MRSLVFSVKFRASSLSALIFLKPKKDNTTAKAIAEKARKNQLNLRRSLNVIQPV